MRRVVHLAFAVLLISTCTPPPPVKDFPCEVATLVSTKCLNCHGAPLTNAAPMAMLKREDFTVKSNLFPDETIAQRSLVRMKQTAAPMPPTNAPPLTTAEVSAFERWVNNGLPGGNCQLDPDAGLPIDAGPPMLTCLSGQKKPRPTTMAPAGEDGMAPGFACNACHAGMDFEGQNPFGALGMWYTYDAVGTVYAAPNEEDLCISTVGPDAGVVVEVFDSTGALVLTAPVIASGNFVASVPNDAGVRLPYTARTRRGTAIRQMTTPQTERDCNTCHTAYGREGAPGRILAP